MVEHGHPDSDSGRDLVQDQRLGGISGIRGDFEAAVHRPRMEDDRVFLEGSEPLPRQAVTDGVLALRREEAAAHPLTLDRSIITASTVGRTASKSYDVSK